MKKIAEFEVNNYNDRYSLCSILSAAGYPVAVEDRTEPYRLSHRYFVVVYEKDKKGGE